MAVRHKKNEQMNQQTPEHWSHSFQIMEWCLCWYFSSVLSYRKRRYIYIFLLWLSRAVNHLFSEMKRMSITWQSGIDHGRWIKIKKKQINFYLNCVCKSQREAIFLSLGNLSGMLLHFHCSINVTTTNATSDIFWRKRS